MRSLVLLDAGEEPLEGAAIRLALRRIRMRRRQADVVEYLLGLLHQARALPQPFPGAGDLTQPAELCERARVEAFVNAALKDVAAQANRAIDAALRRRRQLFE